MFNPCCRNSHATPASGQIHPSSRLQVEEQPSPSRVFPSSQPSPVSKRPFPHLLEQLVEPSTSVDSVPLHISHSTLWGFAANVPMGQGVHRPIPISPEKYPA